MTWVAKFGMKSAPGGSRTGSDAEAEAHKSAPGANAGQSGGELSAPAASGEAARKIELARIEVVVGREPDQGEQASFIALLPLDGAPVHLLDGDIRLRLIEFTSRDADAGRERKAAGA